MPIMPTAVVSHCPQIALPTQASIYMCVMLPRPEERLLFPSGPAPYFISSQKPAMIPPSRDPRIPIEKFYRAALYLVVGSGQVDLGQGVREMTKVVRNLFTVFP